MADDKSLEEYLHDGEEIRKLVVKWVTEFYGDKCDTFDNNCILCRKWLQVKELFADLDN